MSRLVAVQRCPVVPKAPQSTPSSARSRSASSITICAFFPPSSSETRFSVLAERSAITLPTSEEPVKEIIFTSGCMTMGVPTVLPPPCTIFTTPSGTPASTSTSIRWCAEAGVSLAGFRTTVFPATSAGKVFQEGIAMGKFQGVMRPHTPSGWRTDIANLSGSSDGTVAPNRRLPSAAM